ncbi:MAG: hypothetical protein F6K23_37700 [Okeania sp. SIO2C9]|uniref:thermonuclease family protein n=1 Tax=Okeania sp. SIO2C9 TaxID=2607791 RepID=UPI0013C1FA1D|nr:thermonuclease family protein [Okeania sp. SIO2C9]NEQ78227.1 hypothetical protein [Okeania sp. SIO2C9]
MVFSIISCNRSNNTITTFRDSGIPETEYWEIKSVVSGNRLTINQGLKQRTLQLCGLNDITPEAKSYLEQQIKQSPETVPTIFAGKDKQDIWYGDVWVGTGNSENSASGLLLFNGLGKLSEDYYTCPDSDTLKLAEDLAKEQKSGIWRDL